MRIETTQSRAWVDDSCPIIPEYGDVPPHSWVDVPDDLIDRVIITERDVFVELREPVQTMVSFVLYMGQGPVRSVRLEYRDQFSLIVPQPDWVDFLIRELQGRGIQVIS